MYLGASSGFLDEGVAGTPILGQWGCLLRIPFHVQTEVQLSIITG